MDEKKQDIIEDAGKGSANVKLALFLGSVALIVYVGFMWFNLK